MHTQIVILAGGVSSRMKKSEAHQKLSREVIEQANSRSKGLIEVGNGGRPFLDYLLYNVKQAGYREVLIVIGPNDQLFPNYYGDHQGDRPFLDNLRIRFAIQHIPDGRQKPCGTADALLQALQQHQELQSIQFTACNSDNLYSVEALKALRNSTSPNALISYNRDDLEFPPDRIARFAVMRIDQNGFLVDIVEKPTPEQIESFKDDHGLVRVNMNAFKFDGSVFFQHLVDCPFDQVRNEKELPTAMLNMIKEHPGSVVALPFSEHVPDLTAKDDIAAVKAYLAKHFDEFRLS